MMTYNLPVLNTQAFSTAVHEALDAQRRLFEPYMMEWAIPQGSESRTWERISKSGAPREVTGRFEDTTYEDVSFSRRRINRVNYKVDAIPIDRNELKNIVFTPDQYYVREQAKAVNKGINDRFMAAFEESVTVENVLTASGAISTTTATFDTNNIIPRNYVASGSPANSGLTVAKLDRVVNLAEERGLMGDDYERDYPLTALVTVAQTTKLYNEARTSSSDFAHFFQFDEATGKIRAYRGIKFIYKGSGLNSFVDGGTTVDKIYVWHPESFIYDPAVVDARTTDSIPTKDYNGQVVCYYDYNVLRVREESAFIIQADR